MSKPDDPLVKTSVSIRESQKVWAERNHVNISSVTREALDMMMQKVKYV